MQKMTRILYSHGFDPLKTEILETNTANGKSIVYIKYDNIKYELDGNNKRVIIEEEISNEFKKPRGWHFMAEYIDPEGNVYHKGVLQKL